MTGQEIILDNKKCFYRIQGNGPVVVLLHGFAEDSSIWDGQYDALPHSQMIIPDLPGSGSSEMIADMSMEGLADWVYRLLMAVRVDRCLMIGHSMGGYVALAFAEKYPDLLNGLGLFHSTSYPDTEEKKATRKKGIEFIGEHGAFAFLKTSIPNLYSPITKEKKSSLIDSQIAVSRNFSDAALVSYYKSMMQRPGRKNVLEMLNMPVLFVLGKYDAAVPLNDGLEQCHLPDLSYIHILGESGHMGMREETEKSNQILNHYFNCIDHQTQ